jgi:hypothetical protein
VSSGRPCERSCWPSCCFLPGCLAFLLAEADVAVLLPLPLPPAEGEGDDAGAGPSQGALGPCTHSGDNPHD